MKDIFNIKGMTCSACSSRLERVIANLEGVDTAQVNLAAETLTVEYNADLVSHNDIGLAVINAGFEAFLQPKGETVVLPIKGMTCSACSSRLERVLNNSKQITTASVNLSTEKASITYKDITIDDIKKIISDAGFEAGNQESALNAKVSFDEKEKETISKLALMKKKFVFALIFTFPLLIISMGHMGKMPLPEMFDPQKYPLNFGLIQLLLTMPVVWVGQDFYKHGFKNLLRKSPNMDSLIAVGTSAALIYSLWNLTEIILGIDPYAKAMDLYFESAATIITLILLGNFQEARAKSRTTDSIKSLLQLSPATAILLKDDEQIEIAASDLKKGDHILIRTGDRFAADGVIYEGVSDVDESMLTGESMPVTKKKNDNVAGGTVNIGSEALKVEVTHCGEDSVLARIIKLVQEAQGSKAPISRLADTASFYFVPTVMGIALVAGLSWYFIGAASFEFSLRIFISVLVIACPCAMGLATPTAIMVGTGRGAELGVLIKTGEALEKTGKVNTIVFDKTGTLTYGRPELADKYTVKGYDEDELLALAASAEMQSEHPVGKALSKYTKELKNIPATTEFKAYQGLGIATTTADKKLLLGNKELMAKQLVSGLDDKNVTTSVNKFEDAGQSPLYMSVDGSLAAVFAIADQIKDEAKETITRLKQAKIKTVMLTGDNKKTAEEIARQAGIDEVVAEVMPDKKAQVVKEEQANGNIVAMVGDGINDAPAMATADVGIAMGTGIDVAIESGDIVLMNGNLKGVLNALSLSRSTVKNIKENLFWAFAFNTLGIPIAAGIPHIWGGPTLSPMIAAAAMSISSVTVVTNALRLKFFVPR